MYNNFTKKLFNKPMFRKTSFILLLCILLVSCMKDFTTTPNGPDSWSPSWSLPIGAVTIPFDTTVFDGFIPDLPAQKSVSIPVKFEDYPVFNFDQNEFSLSGTLAFDFSSINDDFSQIKLIEFKLKTENGFPTGVRTVLDVKDGDQNILFSLIDNEEGIFADPAEGSVNQVNEPTIAYSKISLTDERIAQLENAQYLDFELAISVQQIINGIITQDTVTFRRNYSAGIEVGLRVDLDVDLSN